MTGRTKATRTLGRSTMLLAASSILALGVAACGSSTSSSSSTTTSTGSATTTSTSSAASNSAVTAAQQKVQVAEKPPTSIAQTTPLTRKPPHETIVWTLCENTACVDIGKGMQEAAQALGWTYKTVPYQSANPATLVTALHTALQYHPFAVGLSGVPEPAWSSVSAATRRRE